MTREEFLRRLPERSISNGRVVSIRDEISSKLCSGALDGKSATKGKKSGSGGAHTIGTAVPPHRASAVACSLGATPEATSPKDGCQSVTLAETPALSMLKRSATRGELSADRDVTTLRIKLPGNGASLLAKMY